MARKNVANIASKQKQINLDDAGADELRTLEDVIKAHRGVLADVALEQYNLECRRNWVIAEIQQAQLALTVRAEALATACGIENLSEWSVDVESGVFTRKV